MGASLFPLFRPRRGWTNAELAQFTRIERLLEDSGFAVEVEHGVSDEGEPWCVFCSRITGDVIIHAACIDGRFMIDSPTLPRPIEGGSFERCAERFFEDCALPPPVLERRGGIQLHPSALLASLFITIMLYAHATSGRDLFAEPAIDADGATGSEGVAALLALKLKVIAQQVGDFVAQDASSGPGPVGGAGQSASGQTAGVQSSALAVIPAGMALAVLAIAQDLSAVLARAESEEGPEGDDTLLVDGDDVQRAAILADPSARDAAHAAAGALAAAEASVALPDEDETAVAEDDGTLAAALAAMAEIVAAMARSAEGQGAAERSAALAGSDTPLAEAGFLGLSGLSVLGELAETVDLDFFADAQPDGGDGTTWLGLDALFDALASGDALDSGDIRVTVDAEEGSFELARLDTAAGGIVDLLLSVAAEVSEAVAAARLPEEDEEAVELAALFDNRPADGSSGGEPARGGAFGERAFLPETDGFDFVVGDSPLAPEPPASRDRAVAPTEAAYDPPAEAERPAIFIAPEVRSITRDQFDDYMIQFAEMVGGVAWDATREVLMVVQSDIDSTIRSENLRVEVFEMDDATVTFIGTEWDFHGFV